jgi:hypothetical protein
MDFKKLLENKYLYGALIICIVSFVHLMKVDIVKDSKLSKIMNSNLFRLVLLTVIAYISTQDMVVSLILSIGFIALLIILKHNKILENYKTNYNRKIDLNREENKFLQQPGLMNKTRCDPANLDTKFSFNTPPGCNAYSDEATEYNL